MGLGHRSQVEFRGRFDELSVGATELRGLASTEETPPPSSSSSTVDWLYYLRHCTDRQANEWQLRLGLEETPHVKL